MDYELVGGGDIGVQALPENERFMSEKYEVVSGREIESRTDAVLIIDQNNRVSEKTLQFLGVEDEEIDYEKIIGKSFRFLNNNVYYPNIKCLPTYTKILKLFYRYIVN